MLIFTVCYILKYLEYEIKLVRILFHFHWQLFICKIRNQEMLIKDATVHIYRCFTEC